MSAPNAKSVSGLGFLTVVEHPQLGLFGGYLVLNMAGRPVEFHCTAPVKPNRAQEILYGPTLQPYLFGEQIGGTLLSKSQVQPLVICTDREPVLAVRQHVGVPVALVLPGGPPPDVVGETPCAPRSSESLEGRSWRLDPPHPTGVRLCPFRVGRNSLAVAADRADDCQTITDRLAGLDESLDLAEPFSRIREAIAEARRGG